MKVTIKPLSEEYDPESGRIVCRHSVLTVLEVEDSLTLRDYVEGREAGVEVERMLSGSHEFVRLDFDESMHSIVVTTLKITNIERLAAAVGDK